MLERAIILGAGDEEVYHNLGTIYLRSQNVDKAIRAYQKAIRINNEYADPHLGLASAFFQQGKLQESLKEINKTLQIDPQYASAYYQLGRIYGEMGMKKKSVSALKEYSKHEPSGPFAKNAEELIKQLESQ